MITKLRVSGRKGSGGGEGKINEMSLPKLSEAKFDGRK